jgi:hypothetical protein
MTQTWISSFHRARSTGVSSPYITTYSLPPANANAAYSASLSAAGGAGGYVFNLLSQTGVNSWSIVGNQIVGTPTNVETDQLTIQAVDSLGTPSAPQLLSVTVSAANPLTITTTSPLPNATAGRPYTYPMAAMGGQPPYSWSVTAESGSNVWAFSGASLVGSPTAVQTNSITVKVTDSLSNTASQVFALTVSAAAAGNYLGTNLLTVNYYSPEQPFLNICKGGVDLGGPDTQKNADGYPISMVGYSGTVYSQFTNILLNNALNLPPGASYYYPPGSYTLTATGNCTIDARFDASAAVNPVTPGCTISGTTMTITDGGTHSMLLNMTPSINGIKLTLSGITPAAHMTQLSVVQTQYASNLAAGQIFHPLFLNMLSGMGYQRIRFMEWGHKWDIFEGITFAGDLPANSTSGSLNAQLFPSGWDRPTGTYPAYFVSGDYLTMSCTYGSPVVNFSGPTTADCPWVVYYSLQAMCPYLTSWAARPQVSNYNYAKFAGVPYEIQIALCNQLTAINGYPVDPWINTSLVQQSPLMTDGTTFDTQLATLCKNTVGPTQRVYLENSNEVWNNSNNTYNYAKFAGKKMFPTQGNDVYAGQELYGVQTAAVAQIWKSVYGASAFAKQVTVSMGGQTANASYVVPILNYAMAAPDWVAQGNPAPYTQGISAIHFAPYFGSIPLANTNITGISLAASAVVTVSSAANYIVGSTVYIGNVGGMSQINGLTGTVTAISGLALTVNINSSGFSPYTGGGTLTNTSDVTTLLAQPDGGLSMMFAFMYAQSYNGYNSIAIPTGGWIGNATTTMAGIVSYLAANTAKYPWAANVSIELYEMGSSFEENNSPLTAAQATALIALIAAMGRDPRMQYCMFDPTSKLSSNPGYLAALKPLCHGGNYHWDVCATGKYGEWGIFESIMQPVPPAPTAPPKALGIAAYIGATAATFDYYISTTGSDLNVGSLASPWAITGLNSKRSTYTGKRVGIIAGTYNVYSLCQAGSWNAPALGVNGGTSSASTYVASCNSSGVYTLGAATITALNPSGGAFPTVECPVIGQGTGSSLSNSGYLTLDGLNITGSYQTGVWFYFATNGSTVAGQGGTSGCVVQNCQIYNISGNDNDNVSGIYFQQCTAPLVHNCKIYGVQPPTAGENAQDVAAIYTYYCVNAVYEYNTIYNCNQAFRDKYTPNSGATIRYNYVEINGSTPIAALGDGVGGLPGTTYTLHHNIFNVIGAGASGWYGDSWSLGAQSPNYSYYNNTMIIPSGGSGPQLAADGTSAGSATVYNNITYVSSGVPQYGGLLNVTTGSVALCDYNLWGTVAATSSNALGQSAVGNPGAPSTKTLSAWQTAFSLDAHSHALNPTFVNPTSLNPAGFALSPGTAGSASGSSPGSTTGLPSGVACDMGAWGGASPPAQIGSSF